VGLPAAGERQGRLRGEGDVSVRSSPWAGSGAGEGAGPDVRLLFALPRPLGEGAPMRTVSGRKLALMLEKGPAQRKQAAWARLRQQDG